MKTRLVLKPGERGTNRLAEKYGDALVCVRFRYDTQTCKRMKTVEWIVERLTGRRPLRGMPPETLAPLLKASDMPLRALVKAAGGKWDPDKKLWLVLYGKRQFAAGKAYMCGRHTDPEHPGKASACR